MMKKVNIMTTMKTILFISIMLFAVNAKAQTNYYTETKTFQGNGYIYQANVERVVDRLLRSATVRSTDIDMSDTSGRVTLYNKSNRFTYMEQTFKDGSPINWQEWETTTKEDASEMQNKVRNIVLNAFSVTERQRTGDRGLMLAMYINSNTGEVMEVDFVFDTTSPFATIPISVYRKIELSLRNQVKFTPTTYGRRFSFLKWQARIVLN
jgi:hypothetical protein